MNTTFSFELTKSTPFFAAPGKRVNGHLASSFKSSATEGPEEDRGGHDTNVTTTTTEPKPQVDPNKKTES
jgi:hypothetical protein